ncbi:MAG: hypothetical protein LBR70_02900 [Lactobacillaceae bacterium]|jgi:hypothetical protein|nr:hypothetical protein [Lactobacillaceae bacterium]
MIKEYAKNNPKIYAAMAARANAENKILGFDNDGLFLRAIDKELSLLKADKLSEINVIYESRVSQVNSESPQSEILTWDIQKIEAEKYILDSSSPTPFIDGLVEARKIDKSALVDKIISKVSAYNSFMSSLTGERQFYEDKIKEADTVEKLNQIIWE